MWASRKIRGSSASGVRTIGSTTVGTTTVPAPSGTPLREGKSLLPLLPILEGSLCARAHCGDHCRGPARALCPWRDEPWKRRGEEYEALKDQIAGALLDLVESRHAGFRDLVAHQELSTPVTTEHFTSHAGGAIYGLPGVPKRWRLPWLGARTPVKGLWLAGADVVGHGIVGAMMGGVMASAGILGLRGFSRIFGAAKIFAGHIVF